MIVDASLQCAGIAHGFFSRAGGVSRGLYASLNCGFGSSDDPLSVAENRRRALARLESSAHALVTAYQVHSADIAIVEQPWTRDHAPKVDGMVTRRPGIALGILTADCAPILFADDGVGVIGAAHAGWRGALAGVAEATVAAMIGLGARAGAIRAVIGPCIGPESYEVGPDFPQAFLAHSRAAGRFFVDAARPGHHRFDLPGYLAWRLGESGLASIRHLVHDTAADDDFFSYRRATLKGEADYGREISVILLKG
jgi:purine-nucleoside/S-methyl-5'-thioadenosine phosphorylase / adenosine deaminase